MVDADVERQRKGALFGGRIGPAGAALGPPPANTYGMRSGQQHVAGGRWGGRQYGDQADESGVRPYARPIAFVTSHTINLTESDLTFSATITQPKGLKSMWVAPKPSAEPDVASGNPSAESAAPEIEAEAEDGDPTVNDLRVPAEEVDDGIQEHNDLASEVQDKDVERECSAGFGHVGLGWHLGLGGAGIGFIPSEAEEEEDLDDVGEEEQEDDGDDDIQESEEIDDDDEAENDEEEIDVDNGPTELDPGESGGVGFVQTRSVKYTL